MIDRNYSKNIHKKRETSSFFSKSLEKIDAFLSNKNNNIFFMTNLMLTRYLYNYDGVKTTLIHTILSQQSQEVAFFWGYELYYSGFRQETADLLEEIYENFYQQHYPKLGAFIHKKLKLIETDPTVVATIIKNLLVEPIQPKNFESKNPKFITIKPDKIEPFLTKPDIEFPWKYLREVCKYYLLSEIYENDIFQMWRENWLYYSARTPIWKDRIEQYHGRIDNESKHIYFETEDIEEDFYNKYGYEPDEQPLEIQKRCLGIST
jgi:hypothetical protein